MRTEKIFVPVACGLILALSGCSSGSNETELPDLGNVRFGDLNEDQLRRMVEMSIFFSTEWAR